MYKALSPSNGDASKCKFLLVMYLRLRLHPGLARACVEFGRDQFCKQVFQRQPRTQALSSFPPLSIRDDKGGKGERAWVRGCFKGWPPNVSERKLSVFFTPSTE